MLNKGGAMKVISFLSAKGGTGKTTFNMLLASYLRYAKGKRVIAIDFDAPENNLSATREREVDALLEKNPEADLSELYTVRTIQATSTQGILDAIKAVKELKDYDYVIIDTPGSISDGEATIHILVSGILDLAVIPTDVDGMSIASSYSLGNICQDLKIPFFIFYNRIVPQEKKDLYEAFTGMFNDGGMKVSANRIKNTVKLRRDSDSAASHLRSSIHFPEKDIKACVPEILSLFEEVLDSCGTQDQRHHPICDAPAHRAPPAADQDIG